jgi:hypothetical protein
MPNGSGSLHRGPRRAAADAGRWAGRERQQHSCVLKVCGVGARPALRRHTTRIARSLGSGAPLTPARRA